MELLPYHRKYMEVFNFIAYSPQLNPLGPIWRHARLHGTHNRYLHAQEELRSEPTTTLGSMQRNPNSGEVIYGRMNNKNVALFMQ